MNIWADFQQHNGRGMSKWSHYFPIYERHLTSWRNKAITFFEIGVSSGGSLQMWSRFFGPLATIVGIDIDPSCASFESDGVHVRIGDQSDSAFLTDLINEFGAPDIVLDDGSHQMIHIITSFQYLYPRLSRNGLYIVEDLHTAYWQEFGGGVEKDSTFINIAKGFIDRLNADHSRGTIQPDFITRHTLAISFYDSVVVIERGTTPYKKTILKP